MTIRAPERNRAGAAAARGLVLRSRDRFWRPGDLRLPSSTAYHLLGELAEADELRRVRHGLYWRGRRSPFGMGWPPQEVVLREVAPGPGVGPAGLLAANALRFSTQVPRRALYAVPERAPADVGSLRFVSRAARIGRTRQRLNPAEVAFLEVLDGWDRLVELDPADADARGIQLLTEGGLRPERLARAARTEPGRVRVRLRSLLAESGRADLAALVPDADPRTTASVTQARVA
ncbi:MAG: hypothetical protein LCH96_02325 [Actinobacteria bacterium]|nr:hypothetical protein [Actinomycetota bacterium]